MDLPYDTFATADLQIPRRMIGDELGVALVRQCEVTLGGAFHVPLGDSRTQVIEDALAGSRRCSWRAAPNRRRRR